MTEWEKAQAGMLYDANFDETLIARRTACADLCFEYNALRPSDAAGQQTLLRRLLGAVEGRICVTPPFHCDYGSNITVGDNFYANFNCVILDAAPVTFGRNVFIGPNCTFSTSGHPIDAPTRNAGLEFAFPITVGDDVWFGANVVVLPGVTIGSGSVIGGGSVVTKDIPTGVIAVGNPCRVLRKIEVEE